MASNILNNLVTRRSGLSVGRNAFILERCLLGFGHVLLYKAESGTQYSLRGSPDFRISLVPALVDRYFVKSRNNTQFAFLAVIDGGDRILFKHETMCMLRFAIRESSLALRTN